MKASRHTDPEDIKVFFDRIAERYDAYRQRAFYYHRLIENIYLSCIPQQSSVIEFGCGTGLLLSKLLPVQACGVDFSSKMIEVASKRLRGTNAQLSCSAIEEFTHSRQYDYAVISNTLEYVTDIETVFLKAHAALNEDGKIVVTTINPVWRPFLRIASALHLRTPDIEKNFITLKDIVNLLELADFEIIEDGLTGAIPFYVPFIVPFLNFCISEFPLLRQLGSIQYVIAKKRRLPRDYRCSVIVPCYNEKDNVETIIRQVPALGISTELIFVDDGSTDTTCTEVHPEVRRDIDIRCISYQPNRGKGYALKQGLEAARGEIIIILDADLSVPAEEVRKFYHIISGGQADFTNGSRFVYPMEGRAMRLANYIGNKLFCLLISWIIKQRVTDTLCGTKAFFKKDCYHIFLGRDLWGDYDFLLGAARLRLLIRDVPIHYRERKYGRSKMRVFRHAGTLFWICIWGIRKIKVPLIGMRQAKFS